MSDNQTPEDEETTHYRDYPIVYQGQRRDDFEWIGVGGGAGFGNPRVYDPDDHAVYRAEVDEDAGHATVDEAERRDLDENETLGDAVAEFGEEHGWTWLSDFAHDHMDTSDHPGTNVIDREFQRRNLAESADADVGFFGSYTYRDDDGRVHTLEREFEVHTDESRRTQTGQPVAVVEEAYLTAEEPNEESRAGDAELESRTRREVPVDVDPDAGVAEIAAFCEEWHEANPEPISRTR
ncbi:hypothetical protein [Halomicrobium urmianum]|uniref:hypothetical protein n=1 Tax=Halomicrobium urmianum TaxID=1586233 RepID=UPI001CD968A3|nr:hypothetical protein [Halomicrobium urmianum]